MGAKAMKMWSRLQSLPAGKFLFSKLLGLYIPYTGSIGAIVQSLEPGHSRVALRERRKVRNHLNSVHAIALANLAELSTGLAALSGMPDNARGILTKLDVTYLKKARGTLLAESRCEIPSPDSQQEFIISANVYDEQGDTVAEAQAHWLIGPIPPPK